MHTENGALIFKRLRESQTPTQDWNVEYAYDLMLDQIIRTGMYKIME